MRRALTAVAVTLAAGTAVGLAVLWPGDSETRLQGSLAADTQKAEVVEVNESLCPGFGDSALPAGHRPPGERPGGRCSCS